MMVKQFAIPLDASSKQTGDITFEDLAEKQAVCVFRITHIEWDANSTFGLITKKNGSVQNHAFDMVDESGSASARVTAAELAAVYSDAAGGDWDYVEAHWTMKAVDLPTTSAMTANQLGNVDNLFGWPPQK
jgi:hypothetical protein